MSTTSSGCSSRMLRQSSRPTITTRSCGVNLIGLEGEGIKEIAEAARIEDRNHFEALVPRIYELGGTSARGHEGISRHVGLPAREPPEGPEGTSRRC